MLLGDGLLVEAHSVGFPLGARAGQRQSVTILSSTEE